MFLYLDDLDLEFVYWDLGFNRYLSEPADIFYPVHLYEL